MRGKWASSFRPLVALVFTKRANHACLTMKILTLVLCLGFALAAYGVRQGKSVELRVSELLQMTIR